MFNRRLVLCVVALLAVLVGGTACAVPRSTQPAPETTPSSTNWSNDQLVAIVTANLTGSKSVHVTGWEPLGLARAQLDLRLDQSDAQGTVTIGTIVTSIIAVHGTIYVQLTDSVINSLRNPPSALTRQAMLNKWAELRPGAWSAAVASISDLAGELTYPGWAAGPLAALPHVTTFVAAGTVTVNGTSALHFAADDGTTMDVASAAPHNLVHMFGEPDNPFQWDFTDWNKPMNITAPPADQLYTGPGTLN